MIKLTSQEYIDLLRKETDQSAKRREQLIFDIATFIKNRAKDYAKKNFIGRGPGDTARTQGRSGNLRNSIEMWKIDARTLLVTAGKVGVPYAAVHEFGAIIKPVRAGALTIPAQGKYVGMRAREFNDLHLVKGKNAVLINSKNEIAYYLKKSVKIPPRPYLKPAVEDVQKESVLLDRLRLIFGSTRMPYEFVRF